MDIMQYGGSLTGAAEQAAVRQGTGVPLTTGGTSGNDAFVRCGDSGFFLLSSDSGRLRSCMPSVEWHSA